MFTFFSEENFIKVDEQAPHKPFIRTDGSLKKNPQNTFPPLAIRLPYGARG